MLDSAVIDAAARPVHRARSVRAPGLAQVPTADPGDRMLVSRAQSGDRAAFNLLVRKYRGRVMKLAMRYMRNHADAEDTVQDIFVRAYGGLRHFRGDSAFYSWLHRIAVNSAKTAHAMSVRHARRFAAEPPGADDSICMSSHLKDLDTPEELALTGEICAAVNDAIADLCEEQRTAIVLRELDGLSYSEVASAMSSPLGTVRSRVFRAREAIDQRLRRIFEEGLRRARARPARDAGCRS